MIWLACKIPSDTFFHSTCRLMSRLHVFTHNPISVGWLNFSVSIFDLHDPVRTMLSLEVQNNRCIIRPGLIHSVVSPTICPANLLTLFHNITYSFLQVISLDLKQREVLKMSLAVLTAMALLILPFRLCVIQTLTGTPTKSMSHNTLFLVPLS